MCLAQLAIQLFGDLPALSRLAAVAALAVAKNLLVTLAVGPRLDDAKERLVTKRTPLHDASAPVALFFFFIQMSEAFVRVAAPERLLARDEPGTIHLNALHCKAFTTLWAISINRYLRCGCRRRKTGDRTAVIFPATYASPRINDEGRLRAPRLHDIRRDNLREARRGESRRMLPFPASSPRGGSPC